MRRYGECSCSPASVTASIRSAAWTRPWPASSCELERTRHFWAALLGGPLEPRHDGEGCALARALEQVEALGGSVVHPGSASAGCKDSEGSPFGLTLVPLG